MGKLDRQIYSLSGYIDGLKAAMYRHPDYSNPEFHTKCEEIISKLKESMDQLYKLNTEFDGNNFGGGMSGFRGFGNFPPFETGFGKPKDMTPILYGPSPVINEPDLELINLTEDIGEIYGPMELFDEDDPDFGLSDDTNNLNDT